MEPTNDPLRELFRMQKALNERVGARADDLSEDHDEPKHI